MSRIWAGIVLAIGLAGCTFSTPFSGSDRVREGAPDDMVIVALTNGKIGGDRAERSRFWSNSEDVVTSLESQPGYLGHKLRFGLWSREVWTMTVWADRESLNAFIASRVHERAMDESTKTFTSSRFARLEVPRAEAPLDWDRALEILETDGREYYE